MNFNAACESKCWNLHLPAQLCVQDAGGKKKKKKSLIAILIIYFLNLVYM